MKSTNSNQIIDPKKIIKTTLNELNLYKSNMTIQKYVNKRLKNMSLEKKNLKNKFSYNNKNNTNTSSSTTISEKSNINKDYSKELSFIPFEIEKEDYNNLIKKEKELEMIKKENKNLKFELKKSKKKINNLEEILNNFLKESEPKKKNECPIPTPKVIKYPLIMVKRKKSKRITKYIREENEDDLNSDNYFVCRTEGNI